MPRGTPLDIPVPVGGARYDLPLHQPPLGFVTDSKNVFKRHGVLIPRPALTKLFATGFGEQVTGGIYYKLGGGTEKVVAGGLTTWKVANFATSAWDDITGTAPTGSADDQWRFVVWPESGTVYLLGVNNVDGPKEWDGVAATYSALTGLSQWTTGKDLTIAANRIIVGNTVEGGTRYPYRVRFSDFNTRSTWSALNFIDITDTNDDIVAVRAINRTAFAALKENSQWLGVAQTGTFPFRMELQDTQPGPASPSSVVERFGVLYYFGQDGSFYKFDGVRTTHIGDRIRKKVQENLNYDTIGRSHGFYRNHDRTFWWFYPTTTNNPTACVSFNQDTEEWFPHEMPSGVEATASWPYKLVSSLSWDTLPAGWTWDTISTDYPTWDSFPGTSLPEELVASTDQVYRFGDTGNDDGTAVSCFWEFFRPFEAGKRARADAFETFFKQASSSSTLTLSIGTTDTLAMTPTYPVALETTFDISLDARKLLDVAAAASGSGTGTAEAQFLAIKHALAASVPWEWRGGVLYAFTTDVE